MAKRTPLSKKNRFEVFKRDTFTCQYCGATPPQVILEVDHVIPVCAGGESNEENLITACFDCNRGKAGNDLSQVPQSIQERTAQMEEAESQIEAYTRLLATKKRRDKASVKRVEKIFCETFEGFRFTEKFRRDVRVYFVPKLLPEDLEFAMELACSRIPDPERAYKYFCGVCWNFIKGSDR